MSHDRKRPVGTVTETELPGTRSAPELTPEEERALRMRTGTALAPDAALPLKAEAGTDTAVALQELEARLLGRVRRHQAGLELEEDTQEMDEVARPVDSATKSKIMRALRKKR